MSINIRAEFEIPQIRHISVQCPKCENWFEGNSISQNHIRDKVDIDCATFVCPICLCSFGGHGESKVVECSHEEVYRDIKKQHTVWE